MLYFAPTTDACPVAFGKWVQIPHGDATVSGESALRRAPPAGAPSLWPSSAMGRRKRPALIRESGYLAHPGPSLPLVRLRGYAASARRRSARSTPMEASDVSPLHGRHRVPGHPFDLILLF